MLNDEHMGKRVSRAAAEKVTLQDTAQNLFMDEQQQQQQPQLLAMLYRDAAGDDDDDAICTWS